MNYLFTICGRAGSKGLANKNLSNFVGVPLAYYTLAAIKLTADELIAQGHHADFALSTDSPELTRLVVDQDALPVYSIVRSPELSGDRVAKVSVINDLMLQAQEHFGVTYDFVIDLDLTAPLRTKENVLDAIRIKEGRRDTDVVYSVAPARKNPYFNMAQERDGLYEKVIRANFISRQETPPVYDMNASIYVYEPRALMHKEPTDFFNSNADAVIMRDTGILDIDCKEDKDMMEVLAEHYFFLQDEGMKEIRKAAEQIRKIEK